MKKRIIRWLFVIVVGILIVCILHFFFDHKIENKNNYWDYISSIVITFLVWEGNLKLDRIFNTFFPWQKAVWKRVLIQLSSTIPFTILTIYITLELFHLTVCKYPQDQHNNFLPISVGIGLLITVIILLIEIGAYFFKNWKKSLLEIEKHKGEIAQAQLQNLKNQINPHFLFNNLSVLSSLVYSDQNKAVDFINQLSKVYRYVLEHRDSELVTIESEITFIDSYIFLLKIRFSTNIEFKIDVEENIKHLLIPPMSLQILVENAIKHNEISSEQPLFVTIKSNENCIEVENKLQLRLNSEPSSNTGLQNIKDRYSYFTEKEVQIIQTSRVFIVKLPILLRSE